MLEVHPPHAPTRSWKEFLVHIAAIAVGLLLAIGLEQAVEAVHHSRQRAGIEAQMRAVLASDLDLNARNFAALRGLRAYLVELKAAIVTRLHGTGRAPQPPVRDPRTAMFLRFPSLAPYEVAQKNGTVALLPPDRIRLYNRLAFALDLAATERDRWFAGLDALVAFQERFVDTRGSMQMNSVATAPDVETLAPADLAEYLAHVASLIQQTNLLYARLDLVDAEIRAILDGVRTEDALLERMIRSRPHGFGLTADEPAGP